MIWSASVADRTGRPLLVLLHGYNSNEGDLFGLAPYLPLEPAIASLRAPIFTGYGNAWFPLPDERKPRWSPAHAGWKRRFLSRSWPVPMKKALSPPI